jgi:hypothetical protein
VSSRAPRNASERVVEGPLHSTHALADSATDFKARFKLSLAAAFAAALAQEKGQARDQRQGLQTARRRNQGSLDEMIAVRGTLRLPTHSESHSFSHRLL